MALSSDGRTLIIGTCIFWAIAIVILPFTILCGKQGPLIRVMTVTTAACCWSMWILVFISQMNLLEYPERTGDEGCNIQ
jgi:hypothetical protein